MTELASIRARRGMYSLRRMDRRSMDCRNTELSAPGNLGGRRRSCRTRRTAEEADSIPCLDAARDERLARPLIEEHAAISTRTSADIQRRCGRPGFFAAADHN
jgi:hypothetical protein